MNDSRTDLDFIRTVLTDALEYGNAAATKKHGLHRTTLRRWQEKRRRCSRVEKIGDVWVSHVWPTNTDIREYRERAVERADSRERRRRQAASWRRSTYINRGPMLRSGLGSSRKLQALMALGWTQTYIAERLGVEASRVSQWAVRRHENMHLNSIRRIDKVYRELCMKVPTNELPEWVVVRQKNTAREQGWAPPLAWDNIDDPNEKPTLGARNGRKLKSIKTTDQSVITRRLAGDKTVAMSKAERTEVVRRAREQGMTYKQIAEVCGINHPEKYIPNAQKTTRSVA